MTFEIINFDQAASIKVVGVGGAGAMPSTAWWLRVCTV